MHKVSSPNFLFCSYLALYWNIDKMLLHHELKPDSKLGVGEDRSAPMGRRLVRIDLQRDLQRSWILLPVVCVCVFWPFDAACLAPKPCKTLLKQSHSVSFRQNLFKFVSYDFEVINSAACPQTYHDDSEL